MTTHFVQWDRVRDGRKSLAICGAWVLLREHSTEPTCEECQEELAHTEEEMFGEDKEKDECSR